MTPQEIQTVSRCFSCLPNPGAGAIYQLDLLGTMAAENCWGFKPKPGINWDTRTSANANAWGRVVWAESISKFVAIAQDGNLDQVMTSPDGINWTAQVTPQNNVWQSIAWSPSIPLFVVVSSIGTNRVMTSPDGITWTLRVAAAANQWQSVTWSPSVNLFVAISNGGTNRVMTSPDGITWTSRSAAAANSWQRVIWAAGLGGGGLFVAVSQTGTLNRVMTSPDGITWTSRTTPESEPVLRSLGWSQTLGMIVSFGSGATGNIGITSLDGITWTQITVPMGTWRSIVWVEELEWFIAASQLMVDSTGEIATSDDGITWTVRETTEFGANGIAWSPSNCRLVSVGITTPNVITSG